MISFLGFLVLSLLYLNQIDSRQVKWELNPGCPADICNQTTSLISLIHIQSVDKANTLHFIITSGSRIGLPSVLIVRTLEQSTVSFNWTLLASEKKDAGIIVSGSYDLASSLTFMQLIAYNDVNDTARMPPSDSNNSTTAVELNNLMWMEPKLVNSSGELFVMLQSVSTSINNTLPLYGDLELQVSVGSANMRGSVLPRLLYTGNNSLINMVLRQMNNPYANTRYAVQVLMTTQRPHTEADQAVTTFIPSMDDEYTPGIFKVFTMQLDPMGVSAAKNVYLQWKKICYTTDNYNMKDSTQMEVGNTDFLTNTTDQRFTAMEKSIAYAFFGGDLMNASVTTSLAVNFTFGQSQDKFYRGSNFTSWTLSYGVGEYPKDSVSLLVILVIIGGFGVPVLLIIAGGIFVIVRKYRRSSAPYGYGSINT